MALAGLAVIGRVLAARLPALNPPPLWHDDLVYVAVIRSESFLDMVTAPIHVAPGPLVLWRGMHTLIPDPEWALQLLPFVCGIAAIPLMAFVAWRLTGDDAVALLAGAVTSLVQLLADYTIPRGGPPAGCVADAAGADVLPEQEDFEGSDLYLSG